MARAIWKGAISFGLVTVPVGLYSAIETREELSFRLLHEKDHSPIDYRRVCEKEGVEVPWSDIVKGYEYQKGRFVVLTDEDFEKARVPASDTFDIRAFVPAGEIDFVYFDHPYYLVPTGKGGAKAYALLRDALAETGRVGIGTIVLRQREHLAALEPAGQALALTTMRFAAEIRPASGLGVSKAGGYTTQEKQLARKLVDSLGASWDPTDYKDTYTDVLKKAIKQKISGKGITAAVPENPRAVVVDLRKALEESLKGGAKRREAVRRRVAGRRRARPAA
jgi:DNA end-binding protein Ku